MGGLGDGGAASRNGLTVHGVGVLDVEAEEAGVGGHSGRASNNITTESPIRTSACATLPFSLVRQASSSASKALFM